MRRSWSQLHYRNLKVFSERLAQRWRCPGFSAHALFLTTTPRRVCPEKRRLVYGRHGYHNISRGLRSKYHVQSTRLSSLRRHLFSFSKRWETLKFPNDGFARIPEDQKVEEETIPDYVASRYYPAYIGETLLERYQLVSKLGFGASSTVWLARDLIRRRHVVLKLYVTSAAMGKHLDDELNIYRRMEKASKKHPGYRAVRSLLDSFNVDGPDGQHRCLVHIPLWESVLSFLHRNPVARLPCPVLAFVLQQLFLALDFLHTECQIVHTDIKADNIMFGIRDDSFLKGLEESELLHPSPRKLLTDRMIYRSRRFEDVRACGAPVLCDFGSAVVGDIRHKEDIQPNVYRAPEVILEIPWTYSVDVWNVECMIWDIFEGGHLFTGHDPEHQTYRSRAHLAEIIALLGPPPQDLLAQGSLSHKFFSKEGSFCAGIDLPKESTLEERETTLEGQEKTDFLRLMRKMLQWDPAKRSSAIDLAKDEWIRRQIGH